MSLIVETGTASANSESYISVADADAYHAARMNAAWSALATPDKEANLRKATEYMQGTYRGRWKGFRTNTVQALDWPRQSVCIEDATLNSFIANNVVPVEVTRACAELALKASAGELAPDTERVVTRETIGPLTTEYDNNSMPYTKYRAIDNMLRVYLKMAGAATALVRT